jgi:FkbM family methyltransferase
MSMRTGFRNWIYLSCLRRLATAGFPSLLDQHVNVVTRVGARFDARVRDLGGAIDVFALGAYEFKTVDWSGCEYAIDVGAQVGSFTLWLACRSTARVFSIEPNPETYSVLVRNIDAGGLSSRVRSAQVALGGQAGERTLYVHKFSEATSLLATLDGETQIAVPAVTLRTLIADSGFPRVDLLKIDVEGAEWEVFESLRQGDLDSVATLLVEWHPVSGHSYIELAERIRDHGFEVAVESFASQAFLVAIRRELDPGKR